MITLGQYIRQARDEKDISLREFSKKIGCSAAFLSDIELGRRNPSEDVFTKIAKELKVSFDTLKEYDNRISNEDIRKLSVSDPGFAFAFRTMIDKEIPSEELTKFLDNYINKRSQQKKK